MALTAIKNSFLYPGLAYGCLTTVAVGITATLDAAGEYIGWVGQAMEDMVITHVGFAHASPTGAPTANISIQTIGTDGLFSADWNTTEVTTGSLGASSAFLAPVALTNSATISRGQFFGVKIAYNSGTSFITRNSTVGTIYTAPPYQIINTGTPTISRITAPLHIILGSSSTAFYTVPGLVPFFTLKSGGAFNNAAGLIRGVHFSLPFDARISGIIYYPSTTTGDMDIAVRDSSGTIIGGSNTSIDGSFTVSNQASRRLYFDTPINLDAGTFYKVTMEPTSVTNIQLDSMQVTDANYKSALVGGADFYYTDNSGGWNTVTTDIPLMDLILDQIDDGAGGGGSSTAYVIG